MYIDLIILIALLVIVLVVFRKFSSFIYFFAIIDIFLRILTGIKLNISLPDVAHLIDTYIPASISAVVGRYISGIFYTIFIWVYIVIYIIFLSYVIRTFWKKKK